MTHGPPKGILDHTLSGDSAGSTLVFEALARARPRLHCFGHLHEGWGAKLVTWAPADQMSAASSYSADIGEARSVLVADLSTLRGGSGLEHDGQHSQAGKRDNDSGKRSETCYATSHCSGDTHSIEAGSRTLFVNASIKGVDEDYPLHLPWLVDIELPKASFRWF
ncbi:serine/threonine phosphatase [Histoplasma capsulatum var. duboisii H88]|nr:serine/threonine phosphatase [Histoplasma capsulatum var. duboisii H88]